MERWLLHRAVFEDEPAVLERLLDGDTEGIDCHGPRGEPPLLLAAMLGRRECAEVLLRAGADPRAKGRTVWPPLAEAVSFGDRALVETLFRAHNARVAAEAVRKGTQLMSTIRTMKDCYIELGWELFSWVPLVGRLLPSDKVRIWKRGLQVRLDTTLIDIQERSIARGDRSFVLTADERAGTVSMRVLDRASNSYREGLVLKPEDEPGGQAEEKLDDQEDIDAVMASDLADVDITVSKCSFPRALSGMIFKSERTDELAGHTCRVHTVEGLQVVTRVRREHLSAEDVKANRERARAFRKGMLPSYPRRESLPPPPPAAVDWSGYAAGAGELRRPYGRPLQQTEKQRQIKGTVWMCDRFPLPVASAVQLMKLLVTTGQGIARVEEFMDSTLPPGFPIKLEIPVAMTVSARVVFSAVNLDPVDPAIFAMPPDAACVGGLEPEDEDEPIPELAATPP